MRCPKCGFISFDSQESCGKCQRELSEVTSQLNGTVALVAPPPFLAGALADIAAENASEPDTFDLETAEAEESSRTSFELEPETVELNQEPVDLDLELDDLEPTAELTGEGIEFNVPEPAAAAESPSEELDSNEMEQYLEMPEQLPPEPEGADLEFAMPEPTGPELEAPLTEPQSSAMETPAAAQVSFEPENFGIEMPELEMPELELSQTETSEPEMPEQKRSKSEIPEPVSLAGKVTEATDEQPPTAADEPATSEPESPDLELALEIPELEDEAMPTAASQPLPTTAESKTTETVSSELELEPELELDLEMPPEPPMAKATAEEKTPAEAPRSAMAEPEGIEMELAAPEQATVSAEEKVAETAASELESAEFDFDSLEPSAMETGELELGPPEPSDADFDFSSVEVDENATENLDVGKNAEAFELSNQTVVAEQQEAAPADAANEEALDLVDAVASAVADMMSEPAGSASPPQEKRKSSVNMAALTDLTDLVAPRSSSSSPGSREPQGDQVFEDILGLLKGSGNTSQKG